MELYAIPALPDFLVDHTTTTGIMHTHSTALTERTYLDAQITLRNAGLEDAQNVKYSILVDDIPVYEETIEELPVAGWINLTLQNIYVENPGKVTIVVDPGDQIKEIREDNNALTFT